MHPIYYHSVLKDILAGRYSESDTERLAQTLLDNRKLSRADFIQKIILLKLIEYMKHSTTLEQRKRYMKALMFRLAHTVQRLNKIHDYETADAVNETNRYIIGYLTLNKSIYK